ncbi:MAG: PKD domain-containing protein [Bacteroidota bacterium]
MLKKQIYFWVGFLSLLGCQVSAQVTADFTSNATKGCGTLAVSFTDLSSSTVGNIVGWQWDLGGLQVNTQEAGKIFQTGSYDICLTVTDSEGNTATECKEDYIKINQLPTADFSVDVTEGCTPLSVTFIDESFSDDGNIVEWIWGVGGSAGVVVDNGSFPAAQSVYTIPDKYDINLTVVDDNGCENLVSKKNFLEVHPKPNVGITADNYFQCEPPLLVNFSNLTPQPNTEYFWDFGNGATYVGNTPPTQTYTVTGLYDIMVIGTNTTTGCQDTLFQNDMVGVGYPVVFDFDQSSTCIGTPVQFEDLSPVASSNILWDFGDGNTSTISNPVHQYDSTGCYTISLTREQNGCSSTLFSNVCILVNDLPEAAYELDAALGCTLPHEVNFVSDAPAAVEWFWEFGENGVAGTSSEANPTFSFEEVGIFPIYLTVTDGNGCSTTIVSDTVTVEALQAQMTEGLIYGCVPLDFTLTDSTIALIPVAEWYWEIITPSDTLISHEQNPAFVLQDTGCFDILLAVTNLEGCTDTIIFEDQVCGGMLPMVDFDAIPTDACVKAEILFDDLSSPFVDGWYWEFGDSTISSEQNPTNSYTDTGHYDITLTVYHNGCQNSLVKEDFVFVQPPRANFSLEGNCEQPYTVNFFNTSVGADSIIWDFGDTLTSGTISVADTVSYTYPNTGLYSISLVAFNFDSGCSDTFNLDYFITDPKASFSIDTTAGCAPFTLDIADSSLFGQGYSWEVEGADIANPSDVSPSITFSQPGIYKDVKLTITDVHGCPDSLVISDSIWVNGVTPGFAAQPTFGCNPLFVEFQDTSSSFFGNITEWNWTMGNGLSQAAIPNPNYTFAETGYHPVSLEVTDDWGCVGTLTIPDMIHVTQPFAGFSADTFGCTVLSMNFYDESVGTELTYHWTFGDGESSDEKNPVHEYATEGTYTICLQIEDINGCSDEFCRENYITISNPVANFTADTTKASCPPLIVNFENLSENASHYKWNFGDGSGSSSNENPVHLYPVPGSHDVTLIAYSLAACRDTLVMPKYVEVDGPIGEFDFEYDNLCTPSEVTFYASSNDYYSYIWDFGDGKLDTSGYKLQDTIVHLYNQKLNALPNLVLIDDQGCVRPIFPQDTIPLVSVESDFIASQTQVCNDNTPVDFINLYTSSIPIEGVQWTFPGGIPATTDALNPQVIYPDPGVFDVTLIVHTSECSDTLTKANFISVGEMPIVDFTMSPPEGCAPLVVAFNEQVTLNTSSVEQWDWSFGSSQTSSAAHPSQLFSEEGEYPVQLKVTTADGCQDSLTKTINIFPEVFLAISEDTTICKGEVATLQATITSDTTGINYYWKPDPSLSCTDCLSPQATPQDTTTYTFVAVSPEACEFEIDVTVNVRPDSIPEVTITPDTTICAGDVTQLFASGGDNLFGYNWDASAAGLSCYDACLNPIATPTASTTYTVTVTNTTGCTNTASSTVSIYHGFQNLLGENRTICLGDTVQLNISTGNDPFWVISDGLNCAYCPSPVASPLTTTTYLVRAMSDFGCEIYDSITINVMTPDDIDAGDNQETCINAPVQLSAVGEGIPAWTPDPTLSAIDIFNPIASPDATTTYYFSTTNGDCILTDSVTVFVQQKTEIELPDHYVCRDDTLVLEPTGFADTYQWSPADALSAVDVQNPICTPTENIEYTLIASLGTCEPDTVTALVEILENPEVEIVSTYRFFPGESVLIETSEAESSSNYTYQWWPADGLSCTDCPSPVASVENSQIFTVTITDLLTGCKSTEEILLERVNVCSSDLISMPNVFTPNGDGKNDTFQMYTNMVDEIDYIRIFNRWGSLVYESTDRNFAWNGRYKGKRVPDGVYIYVLSAKCRINSTSIIKKGDVLIHR